MNREYIGKLIAFTNITHGAVRAIALRISRFHLFRLT